VDIASIWPTEGRAYVHTTERHAGSHDLSVHQGAHRDTFSVQALCRVLDVAPSGYYAWLQQPLSHRAQEDARLLRLIRASYVASQGIYGAPRVFLDLREGGGTCSKHRVARLTQV
jgi:HTH-like domain